MKKGAILETHGPPCIPLKNRGVMDSASPFSRCPISRPISGIISITPAECVNSTHNFGNPLKRLTDKRIHSWDAWVAQYFVKIGGNNGMPVMVSAWPPCRTLIAAKEAEFRASFPPLRPPHPEAINTASNTGNSQPRLDGRWAGGGRYPP